MRNKDIIAFIFARSGSKGLKNKNIKKINGKPLIAWSIEHAILLNKARRIIVSTNCHKIAKIARKYGAETPFLRPNELSKDDSPEWLAWQHALNYLKETEKKLPDAFVSIPTTSPLRSIEDLKKSLNLFFKYKTDGVITVTESHRNPRFNMVEEKSNGLVDLVIKNTKPIFRRQDAKKVYDMTTVAFVLDPKFVLNNNSIFEGSIRALIIPKERAIDIDSQHDFEIAEYLLEKKIK